MARGLAAMGALLGTCVLLAGCSTTNAPPVDPSPSASPSSPLDTAATASTPTTPASRTAPPMPAIPPTPAANPVINAMSISTSYGTANIVIDIANSVGADERLLSGTGVTDLARRLSDLTWTGDDNLPDVGSTQGGVREIVTRDGAFLSANGQEWLAFPDGTPTSRVTEVFDGLADVPAWAVGGTEQIDGEWTTRYTGELANAPEAMGLNDQETQDVQATPSAVAITVWVDAQGRVVRILRVLDVPDPSVSIRATTLVKITDYGVQATIEAPEPGLVSTP